MVKRYKIFQWTLLLFLPQILSYIEELKLFESADEIMETIVYDRTEEK